MNINLSIIKTIYTDQKKYKYLAAVLALSIFTVSAAGCGARQERDENAEFEAYTEKLFCSEVSSNTINLHYTLKAPEAFGIEQGEVSAGTFAAEPEAVKASVENMRQALEDFTYDRLDIQNKITYDILEYQGKMTEKAADYILYEEPLGLVSGVQTQYPVVLSEYQFYGREDVDTYLELLEKTGEYFDELIAFEQEKAEAGLFMSDDALDTVLEQCRAFLDMGEGNYLYSTFADRIQEVEELTEEEKSDYIRDNALAVAEYVFPAYENLTLEMEKLRGSGSNEEGLVYLPDGKEYYELLVRQSTGSDRSVEELRDLTRRQMNDDLEAMEKILGLTPGEAQEAAASAMGQESAELFLTRLQEGIK